MLEAIDPFGERRDDRRIALLAQVIVQALSRTKPDGTPYTAADFLRRLPGYDDAAPVAPPPAPAPMVQSVAEMEQRIAMWCTGANVIAKEQGIR